MNPIDRLPRIRITSPLLSGIVNAFMWLSVGAVLASLVVAMTSITEQSLTAATFLIHGIASLFGGFSSGKRANSKGWYYGAILGAIYTAIVVLVGFLSFDAGIGKDTAVMLSIAVPAGAIGGMVGVNAKRS
ncbi:TIGR04086 family membrane protein [Paenibacillus ginsengarvi]|uniref:TIGR04086 family membrane protein n=1 Tax=Paenibacillus ginsengarvi TaxID=400777 RepID=A0A3B0CHF6_9BACL|nr:TIGR04086 family membrane protein [Paenibacillus ginsengarvi]RKN83819.1 TIGR04086 family membrane protein [Paenibacillus ginsengarvi]